MNKLIHVVHLYGAEMNIYGDTGNRLILEQRLKWYGYKPIVRVIGIGDELPTNTDLVLGGGGQDSGQALVVQDLARRKDELQAMAEAGVPMLMICGLYQLFGHYFQTAAGERLPGISVFDMVTQGSSKRLIGNIVTKTPLGEMVGYENHSGLTRLAPGQAAFGSVPSGQGNNGDDKTEGAVIHNVFGSYLHGPILSKNPQLADSLLARVVERRYGELLSVKQLDNQLEMAAAHIARNRPR
jgi:CobQ-like glutamine amidotransferase family enzyme